MNDYLATADVWTVLDLIVAEFTSDPTSTACFDTRIVKRAIELNRERKEQPVMTPEMKIARGRELILEADRDRRKAQKDAENATLCRCGHRRDQHTITYSVNFSGGLCRMAGCKCLNYCEPNK